MGQDGARDFAERRHLPCTPQIPGTRLRTTGWGGHTEWAPVETGLQLVAMCQRACSSAVLLLRPHGLCSLEETVGSRGRGYGDSLCFLFSCSVNLERLLIENQTKANLGESLGLGVGRLHFWYK